jgi:hypothetical protein
MQVRRFKLRGALIAVAASVALAGCGDDSEPEPEQPARIPASVAERLASLSEETAAALERDDTCDAEVAADELARTAEEVESRVPAQLRPEVRAGVEQLTSRIDCVPPPSVEEEQPRDGCPPGMGRKEGDEKEEEDEKGKEDKHQDRGDGGGDGGDGGEDEKGKGRDERDEEKRIEEECAEVEDE